jgi:hypothetical protein
MRFRTPFTMMLLVVVCLACAVGAVAGEAVGRVCVQAISKGESWKANTTGATERSIFTVQIDSLPAIPISTNTSGVFTNLSLTTNHLVKIRLDGKPITSFRFDFKERGDHLRLWYSPFYGTWSLSDVRKGEKCACPKEPSNKGAAANRRPAGQLDGSGNLAAIVAADRAFPAAVAELGR